MAPNSPTSATGTSAPGSASHDHPLAAIPLPAHGFGPLDGSVRELASVPAADVISHAAVGLLNAAAQLLGLAPTEEPELDMADARRLITALAGLLAAAESDLGEHREPLFAGLRTLQNAFREASAHPDAPGEGPGEQFVG